MLFSFLCLSVTLFLSLTSLCGNVKKVNLNLTYGMGSADSHVAWCVKMFFFFKSKAANNVTVW